MIQPRNTIVVLRLIEKTEQMIGAITVPTNGECFTEAEVIAVGPGAIHAEGGKPETFDLHPGQRVLAKHKERRPGPANSLPAYVECTQRYIDNGEVFHLVEQGSIIGILSQPPLTVPVLSSEGEIVGTAALNPSDNDAARAPKDQEEDGFDKL